MKTKILFLIFSFVFCFGFYGYCFSQGEPFNYEPGVDGGGSQSEPFNYEPGTGNPDESIWQNNDGTPQNYAPGPYGSESNTGSGFRESGSGSLNNNANLDCSNGVCFPTNTNLPESDLRTIITNVLNWVLGIFGMIAIIGFVISGIQYILSTGNEKTMDTAKRNMTYCIIGVVVALSGLVIIFAIDRALRGTSQF